MTTPTRPVPSLIDRFADLDVFALASPRIVARGLAYAASGRVTHLAAADGKLTARVSGNARAPYKVEVTRDGDLVGCVCTCPFDWEPFCKHGIAVLAAHLEIDGSRELPTLAALEARELEVRRRRGESDDFAIHLLAGDRVFGTFEVASPSGNEYVVEIRSLCDQVNGCTCLDHATSMIGTCKHIEAVLYRLRKRAPRRFERLADTGPGIAQIVADRRDAPCIRLLLPPQPTPAMKALAGEFFDGSGVFHGDPGTEFARLQVRAHRLRNLVIYDDAIDLAQTCADDRCRRARHDEVRPAMLAHAGRIPGVAVDLYPFQREGVAFLAATGRALLGDEMGLGKTVQAIAADAALRNRGEASRTLVVCPASLKAQWASEIRRFTDLEPTVVQGSPRARLNTYREHAPFTIANYELMLRDQAAVAGLKPDLLILDEAQRIRNWHTKTAEAIKHIHTPFVFVLTGTPLQNRLDDLYSIMQVIDRRVLGPLWAYNERFIVHEEGRSKILGYRKLDELRRRLAPVVLRRTKDEVKLQLPERIDSRFYVGMTAAQRNLMEEGVQTAARYAALAEKRPLRPVELKRLFSAMQMARMACNAAGLVDKETEGSPKLDEFARLLEDLCADTDRKVVVFSEWETFGRLAAARAEALGLGYVRFHGGVPTARRGALIDRFRDDPDCRVFISTDAGGVGLNLQFASSVINLELPWNPAVLEQRIGRVHRHGQTEPVLVHFLIADDSFEAGLEHTLANKQALFGAALDQGADIETLEAPTSCLAVFREAMGGDVVPEFADDIATPSIAAADTTEAPAAAGTDANPRRAEHLAVARRKFTAASALRAAGAGAEAMAQAHACMLAVARSLACDDGERDPAADLPPARLIYEVLVPRGLLSLEQAALIGRAEGLAASYTNVAQAAPEDLVEVVLADACGFMESGDPRG